MRLPPPAPADAAGPWPPPDATDPLGVDGTGSSWISRQVEVMGAAWARGESVGAEAILAENPGLGDEEAIRLIYEEFCLRIESGEDVATAEFVARFPRWEGELGVLLGCDRLLRPLTRIATLPEVGEELGPFRLLAELGRGASGRTYLAAEPALADRLVVLKVISDDQEEHLSLARLQHTHIIPLFSEHTFPDRGLRALCMPYLGGTSLARILESLAPIPLADRRGHHILEVLDRVEAVRPEPMLADGPYRLYLEKASYVEAICWIGACLAEALQDAHSRGLVHMDVKPSNVLIAADGHPMLLDFHLACKPIEAGERFPDRIGGTPGWMAPEHAAAMEAVSLGQPIPEAVGAQADLYALGLLLRSALGGPVPGLKDERGSSLCERNPEVSVAFEEIIRRCLKDRSTRRYPTAAALADDLRRQVEILRERGEKRRRGHHKAAFTMAGIILLVIPFAFAFYSHRVRVQEIEKEIATDLDAGHGFNTRGQYEDAIHALSRGIDRARELPAGSGLTRALDDELHLARRGRDAAKLHHLAEMVRFNYGIDPPSGRDAVALLRDIRVIWKRRESLLTGDRSEVGLERERQVHADLQELVAAWAEVRISRASPDEASVARAEALDLLDEAWASCGPSFAIDHLRRRLALRPGETDHLVETEPVPKTAPEHYDLGRSYLRSRRFEEAAAEFRASLERRPQDFWPNYYAGLCAYRLKSYQDAFTAFSICIALKPTIPQSFFNRALAAEALDRTDQALGDYRHAWELDDHLTDALLNRGILCQRLGRFDEAVADYRKALDRCQDRQARARFQYRLALAYLAQGERSLALACANEAAASGDSHACALRDQLLRDR